MDSAAREALRQRNLQEAEEQHDAEPYAYGSYFAPKPIPKKLVPAVPGDKGKVTNLERQPQFGKAGDRWLAGGC